MGGCLFSVLVDESRDISVKEQMAVVVRFVSKKGELIERFLGIKHVTDTTSEALKRALVELVVVAVSRCCSSIEDFFDYVALIVNTTSSSCRRNDLLLDKYRRNLLAKLESGEMSTGRGKHQETSLARPGDTRWGSHYKTLFRIESMWDSVIEVLDAIITELDHRFNEVSTELLVNFSCLDPRDSFSKLNVDKLARLTEIYFADFSFDERKGIKDQLKTFIVHVRRLEEFRICHDLASLAKKMVELERHIVFPSVYRLIELALLLPVATASVERAFSAMKIIKTELRNKMSDAWCNDLMVCYIERGIFKGLDFGKIKKEFQKKGRRIPLPRSPRRN
ncbi:uncharacterized protein LOC133923227 [Phragmites australis]|uniref:uncharacterized protein LOC133923227 n=1 Tax=Phragmites australis TaxID=29695 RepID=UPI002D78D0FD|nr:uncharacterized protein LOC133923227 [Phragmites australis]